MKIKLTGEKLIKICKDNNISFNDLTNVIGQKGTFFDYNKTNDAKKSPLTLTKLQAVNEAFHKLGKANLLNDFDLTGAALPTRRTKQPQKARTRS